MAATLDVETSMSMTRFRKRAPKVFHTWMLLTTLLVSIAAGAGSPEPTPKLQAWYRSLGPPRESEDFGSYLARAARAQHGVGYQDVAAAPGPETLQVDLEAFECVSFIESAIAVARCGWSRDTTEGCFRRELERTRYRKGEMGNYASRLHYFVDWIEDNETRGRIENLTVSLGGEPHRKEFFHISKRVLERSSLPAGDRSVLTREMEATEQRLSNRSHAVLSRERAPRVLDGLRDGDLVAFVRERPGLLVHHAGFIYWANGTPRLLHASSYHARVVITSSDVTDYLLRRPERRGVIVARPLAPVN